MMINPILSSHKKKFSYKKVSNKEVRHSIHTCYISIMYVNAFLYCKSFALVMDEKEKKIVYTIMMMGLDGMYDNAITVTYTIFLYMVTYALAIKKFKDHIFLPCSYRFSIHVPRLHILQHRVMLQSLYFSILHEEVINEHGKEFF